MTVEKFVTKNIAEKVQHYDFDLNEDFNHGLGLDSLEIVELIMDCEKEFGVIVNDFHREEITNPASLIGFIETRSF